MTKFNESLIAPHQDVQQNHGAETTETPSLFNQAFDLMKQASLGAVSFDLVPTTGKSPEKVPQPNDNHGAVLRDRTADSGTQLIDYEDGTKLSKLPGGTQVFTLTDGSVVVNDGAGNVTTTLTDGTVRSVLASGSVRTETADHHVELRFPDGSVMVTDAAGEGTITGPDGVSEPVHKQPEVAAKPLKTEVAPDGTIVQDFGQYKVITNPDTGAATTKFADGTTVTILKDGTKITESGNTKSTHYPDGSSLEEKDGDKIEDNGKGTVKTTFADGATLVEKDGISVLDDMKVHGVRVTTLKDGSRLIEHKDGSQETFPPPKK